MTLSMNEVEATAKRAARGAGYSWGLAEEAGKATRWLCERDVDGCAALAVLLQAFDCAREADWSPLAEGSHWQAPGGNLCPLLAGAALSDHARDLQVGALVFGATLAPVLLLPFAASCAAQSQGIVSVGLPNARAVTDGDALAIDGVFPERAENMEIHMGGEIAAPAARRSRAAPGSDMLQILDRFARRTFAPATEQSRLSGAGAGLSDND
ncbi:DUF3726 domain-containing protein [Hoeflea poritis]|uniref:DUF3726 domain-containing protein n=1 Tax=Hoeflea poritis TaxID=2993659 RepID=A0ABT4VLL4_9HYPH|nr:DUF3726 domain-containing protein [Hoeflea poritis]MDA4845601.1 DUF3726 domain-containing protein [Hoeflea poritis]